MGLEPLQRINRCGYAGLAVTSILDLGGPSDLADVRLQLVRALSAQLGLTPRFASDPPAALGGERLQQPI